jgi:D-alanyl-D-alanine carboxypeptidase (penicillin-binding protein 5/6)
VIFVITGLDTDRARAEESQSIVNWAFRQFVERTVARANVRVAEAEVFMGTATRVGLVPAQDVNLLVPALVQGGVNAEVIYTGPLTAPITAGQRVAELVIRVPDMPETRVPLVAEADVARGGFMTRLTVAGQALLARALAPSS